MALTNDTIRRTIIALSGQKAGNNLVGAVGLYGGFVLNANASVKSSVGDITAIPDSGGAAGTYRVLFPTQNANIMSIDWLQVDGFTPRTPTTAETCAARVTGYNYDTTLKQWYVTVQIVLLSSNAVDATPPQNFVVGVRAAVTLNSAANAL
jgi:hypothetical protein